MLAMPLYYIRYQKTCRYIESCLDLVQYALCFRCAKSQGILPNTKRFHHCGRILGHLTGKCSKAEIESWINDLEHGLFHGMSTFILAALIIQDEFDKIRDIMSLGGENLLVKEKNLGNRTAAKIDNPLTYSDYQSKHCETLLSFENLLASCLLHDFGRFHYVDSHDANLRQIFPNLLEVTYTHTNPTNHRHPLLIADVLELKRYPDYGNWYKKEVVESFLSDNQLQIVQCYFANIRPALETAFRNRTKLWFGHGPEVPQNMNDKYPQHPCKWLAVEIDRLPFQHCLLHDCHLPAAPWGFLRGIMTIDYLKESGGSIKPHMEFYRDHLYVKVDAKFSDWVFVTNQESPAQQKWLFNFVEQLLGSKHKVVELSVLNTFIHLTDHIIDLIKILNE